MRALPFDLSAAQPYFGLINICAHLHKYSRSEYRKDARNLTDPHQNLPSTLSNMNQESSKPSGRRTNFRRFLPGLLKNTKHKSQAEPPPNPVPTSGSDPTLIHQGLSTAAPSTAVALVESAAPAVEDFGDALDGEGEEEDNLGTSIALAKRRLNKAGERLKNKIPPDILEN